MGNRKMVTRKSWNEFKNNGLLWLINSILHVFGWAIVIVINDSGEITDAYPARVRFRGFTEEINTAHYINISKYLKENADELYKEACDEED